MKKLVAALALLFIISFISETEVFADKFNSIPKDLEISVVSVEYQFDNLYTRLDAKQSIMTVGATAGATGLLILLFGGF